MAVRSTIISRMLATFARGGLLGCTPDHVMVTAPVPGTVTCGDRTIKVTVEEGDNINDLDPAKGT